MTEEQKRKIKEALEKNSQLSMSGVFKELSDTQLEEGVVEAIVATDSVDRHYERLDIDTLDIATYMTNPVVLYGHSYSEVGGKPSVIGKTLVLTKEVSENGTQQLKAKFQLAIKESKLAAEVYSLILGGYLKAFSIGFIPKEYDFDNERYINAEMIEFSAVPIPANAEALLTAKAKGLATASVEALALKNVSETETPNEEPLEGQSEEAEETIKNKKVNTEKGFMPWKELMAKNVSDLTVEECDYIRFKAADLTEDEKTKFKALFEKDEELAQLKAQLAEAAKPAVKNINLSNKAEDTASPEAATPQAKFKAWLKGLTTKDYSEYLGLPGVDKKTMVTSDGKVIPPTEFIAEVLRLENEYGVARQFATIRQTDRQSVTLIIGENDVAIFRTAEAGVKQGTVNTYENVILTLLKFAAIVVISDEMLEDSAFDLWTDISNRFSRAYARQEDELVFTDTTSGIVNQTGVKAIETSGSNIDTLTFDELNKAIVGAAGSSMTLGRFFFNRTVLGVIQRIKNSQGDYIWQPGPNGAADGTIWGRPYTLTEVLPEYDGTAQAATAYIVYGDLRHVTIVERTQLAAEIFNAGVVNDEGGTAVNLITQDAQAMRVVKRFNAKVVFAKAFSVISTQ